MKVLLLGDYSNYHAALSAGLRKLGHDVTLASDGCSWLQTGRDIDVSRHHSKVGGAMLYSRLLTTLAPKLRGYDVVQLRAPYFLELRPQLLANIMRRLKRDNGAVYLSALSTDSALVRNFTSATPALAYSEWALGNTPTAWSLTEASQRRQWLDQRLVDYTDAFYGQLDGAVSALYEYHRVIEAEYPSLPLAYGGVPIETEALPAPRMHSCNPPVRILFAAHKGREGEKGADLLLPILRRLDEELPGRIELLTPPNMPYRNFVELLSSVDIVCDQLYSYTPGTTALLALAMGVVPVSGGEEDYYKFIGETSARPIINLDPRDLDGAYAAMRSLVSDPAALRAMSAAGPAFVKRHNGAVEVARRFEQFWQK